LQINIFTEANLSNRKFLSFVAFFALVFAASLQAFCFAPKVNAQVTPYEDSGGISFEAIWYKIYGVRMDDQIFISVTPAMSSIIFSPNMTKVDERNGDNAYLAIESGDYFLRIVLGSDTNYTVKSSHPLSDLKANPTTPYSSAGVTQPQGGEVLWFKLYSVIQNAPVLISFYCPVGWDIYSYVYLPDLTIMDQTYHYHPAAIIMYNFVAPVTGDYAFKIKTTDGNASYKMKSSHPLTSGTQPTISPSATVTPSPVATPSAQPSTAAPANSISPTPKISPVNINAVASGLVTFEVPSTYQSSGANFTYDFGDGTNITTANTSVTHVYQEPGNYTFTLKLEGTPEHRAIETYSVIVTGPSENPIVKYTWPIVTSVTAGLTVAAITALLRRRKKKTQLPNPSPPPPPE
jgi:hypothetical protein